MFSNAHRHFEQYKGSCKVDKECPPSKPPGRGNGKTILKRFRAPHVRVIACNDFKNIFFVKKKAGRFVYRIRVSVFSGDHDYHSRLNGCDSEPIFRWQTQSRIFDCEFIIPIYIFGICHSLNTSGASSSFFWSSEGWYVDIHSDGRDRLFRFRLHRYPPAICFIA